MHEMRHRKDVAVGQSKAAYNRPFKTSSFMVHYGSR
jgi:hypothetical protein